MPDPFDSVLGAAKANADWAWTALYDEHAPRLLQYLRAQRVDDPEGVLGEVMVRVVRSIHGFEGDEDHFRGWLFRIAQRCVIDAGTAGARRSEVAVEAPEELVRAAGEFAPAAADEVERRHAEQRVYRQLAVLPADQRAAVFLRIAHDMPIAEVAEVLGRRESAVKMLLQRGFRTLRDRAEAPPGPPR